MNHPSSISTCVFWLFKQNDQRVSNVCCKNVPFTYEIHHRFSIRPSVSPSKFLVVRALIAWKQRSLGNHLPHEYRPSRRSHHAGWCVWLPWKGNSAFVRRFRGDSPPNRYSTWILWMQIISIGRVPWFSEGNKWISNIQVGYLMIF